MGGGGGGYRGRNKALVLNAETTTPQSTITSDTLYHTGRKEEREDEIGGKRIGEAQREEVGRGETGEGKK